MTSDITEERFGDLLSSVRFSAWRFETLGRYALTYERADFDLFLAGQPVPPPEIGWWRDWLGGVAELNRAGRKVARVRLLGDEGGDEPTAYQRWMLWAHPYYAAAGEEIRYLRRSHAVALGLSAGIDWWLLDDEAVILMYFTAEGAIAGKVLVDDPRIVALYRQWRDLAVHHATADEEIRAA